MNILVLAYLGDVVYEKYVRMFLIESGLSKVKKLQEQAILYCSAKGQCKYVLKMIEEGILLEDELEVFYRGRNAKSHKGSKNVDIITYKHATGLEAVIGYLELSQKKERIDIIMSYILGG